MKGTLSYQTRTKEAATAQRNPLTHKTTEEYADWQAAKMEETEEVEQEARRYHQGPEKETSFNVFYVIVNVTVTGLSCFEKPEICRE